MRCGGLVKSGAVESGRWFSNWKFSRKADPGNGADSEPPPDVPHRARPLELGEGSLSNGLVKVVEKGNTLGCKLHSPIRSHYLEKCLYIIYMGRIPHWNRFPPFVFLNMCPAYGISVMIIFQKLPSVPGHQSFSSDSEPGAR